MHNLISYNQLDYWHSKHSYNKEDEEDLISEYFDCLTDCDEDTQTCRQVCRKILTA